MPLRDGVTLLGVPDRRRVRDGLLGFVLRPATEREHVLHETLPRERRVSAEAFPKQPMRVRAGPLEYRALPDDDFRVELEALANLDGAAAELTERARLPVGATPRGLALRANVVARLVSADDVPGEVAEPRAPVAALVVNEVFAVLCHDATRPHDAVRLMRQVTELLEELRIVQAIPHVRGHVAIGVDIRERERRDTEPDARGRKLPRDLDGIATVERPPVAVILREAQERRGELGRGRPPRPCLPGLEGIEDASNLRVRHRSEARRDARRVRVGVCGARRVALPRRVHVRAQLGSGRCLLRSLGCHGLRRPSRGLAARHRFIVRANAVGLSISPAPVVAL